MTTGLIDHQRVISGSESVGVAFAAVRAQRGLVALLLVLAALAWWATVDQMAGMPASPGADLGSLPWFVGIWVVMMAAMMLPSVAPTVALYARMSRSSGLAGPLFFTAAYLIVWSLIGVASYGVFQLGKVLFGSQLAWDGGGRWVAAGLLAAAAVYEVTPVKNACLARCRAPLGFLLSGRREGLLGSLELGSRHAAWCVGCCVALMAALFALGVMSLVWMAVVAAIIAAQKTVPWRRSVVYVSASLLLALAVGVALVPHSGHGLLVP